MTSLSRTLIFIVLEIKNKKNRIFLYVFIPPSTGRVDGITLLFDGRHRRNILIDD